MQTSAVVAGVVVGGLAVGAGVGVGLYFALRNSCVLYPDACHAGAGVQVHDERSGYTYWYDGADTIHSYGGERLPGVCPGVVAQGATGVLADVPGVSPIPAAQKCAQYDTTAGTCTYAEFKPVCADKIPYVKPDKANDTCAQWSDDGKTCVCHAYTYVGVPPASRSDTPVTPQKFPGVLVAKGPDVFTPGFVVDARTMKLRTSATGEPEVMCSRSLEAVNALFKGAAWTSLKIPGAMPLNVYEMFGMLGRMGVFRVHQ
jgi:hypothetical protein